MIALPHAMRRWAGHGEVGGSVKALNGAQSASNLTVGAVSHRAFFVGSAKDAR